LCRALKLALTLINRPLPFSFLLDFSALFQAVKKLIRLVFGDSAQVHGLRSLNGAMLVNVAKNHLFLLDGVKTSLPDIGGFLPGGALFFRSSRSERKI
jgi:hypothetical protein